MTVGIVFDTSSVFCTTRVHVRRINPSHTLFFIERRRPKMKYRMRFFKRKLYSINITSSYADNCTTILQLVEFWDGVGSQPRTSHLLMYMFKKERIRRVEACCQDTLMPQPEMRRPAKPTKPRASHCQNSNFQHLISRSL